MVKEEKYFVLSKWEDTVEFQILTKEEMLKYLQEGIAEESDVPEVEYIDVERASTLELNFFPMHSILIIKGKVVEPTAVKVIKKLEIE